MTGNVDDVQAHLDQLRDAVLSDWVRVTADHAGAIRDMRNSLSWRITRPLRLARSYQIRAAEVGPLEAARVAAAMVGAKLSVKQ